MAKEYLPLTKERELGLMKESERIANDLATWSINLTQEIESTQKRVKGDYKKEASNRWEEEILKWTVYYMAISGLPLGEERDDLLQYLGQVFKDRLTYADKGQFVAAWIDVIMKKEELMEGIYQFFLPLLPLGLVNTKNKI